jgi:cysteine desulfurase
MELQNEFRIEVEFLTILPNGHIDYLQLATLLEDRTPTLVSLMHVNNETGVVLDLNRVGELCDSQNVYFHSDTVQSIGKTEIDLQEIKVDFLVASAHKFKGPKGIGFAYVKKNTIFSPMIFGGEQEKGLRAGTEGIHQIAGMAKALQLAYQNLDKERNAIFELKKYTIEKLLNQFPSIKFNGGLETFYSILNIQLPLPEEKTAIILFELDMKGIAVSRGSACQSGSIRPSHVLAEILSEEELKKPSLRISFNHLNTREEIDYFISCLAAM